MFLWDWFCRKLGLTDLPSHDGKVTSDINFILGPYYRSFRADRDSLYEWLLHSRLLWKKAWNNEYQSEYESVSRISIWINFHDILWYLFNFGLVKKLISPLYLDGIALEKGHRLSKKHYLFYLNMRNEYNVSHCQQK